MPPAYLLARVATRRRDEESVRAYDALHRLLVGLDRPLSALGGTPQDDAVAARLHVDAEAAAWGRPGKTAEAPVVHFRLGYEHGKLSLEGDHIVVAEEVARAEPGAVDHERFVQLHQLPRLRELADDNAPAEVDDVADQSVEIDGRLDAHLRTPVRVPGRKGMLSRPQQRCARAKVRRKQRLLIPFPFALAGCARFVFAERVALEPGHAVSPSHQQLQLAIGDLGGFTELRVPCGGAKVVVNESRRGGEARERHVRGGVGGHPHGVDGDLESVSL